jgi:molybdenum cofactor synthesis domain-containing protein
MVMELQGSFDVEIITTGDEILFGRIVDTNSSWIAKMASEAGARIKRITSVGDNTEEIIIVLKEALERGVELLIFTGGLGPSEDDVTIEAIGKAVSRKVELNPEAVGMIRARCAELGVESNPRRERMARLLEGSKPIQNIIGMASGMLLQEGGTTIVALPGVPEEMKKMFKKFITPMISERATSRFFAKTVTVRIIPSYFFPMYRTMMNDYKDIYLKNAAFPPQNSEERKRIRDIKVDLVVEAPSMEECKEKMDFFLVEFKKRIEVAGGKLIL